ncbi:MAG: esterase family protein [Chloroflexi bacterium]|nr:esterase family protein [Chloroflexota bacterium]
MRRDCERFYSPAVGRDMQVLVFGHYGAPLIAFPSGGGQFFDFENNGMIGAVAHLIDAGKLKVYCPEGLDHESWLNQGITPHWRALRHNAYQDYIVKDLVPAIRVDCNSADVKIGVSGCSLGAYHAANFALKFPHIFHYALAMSGRYDIEDICGWSESQEVYFNNPLAYVPNLQGGDLQHVRDNTHIVLVCGQGAYEEKCLRDTHRLADLLVEKGIGHERDIWGHDVEHHWYWWRKQFAHHLHKALA